MRRRLGTIVLVCLACLGCGGSPAPVALPAATAFPPAASARTSFDVPMEMYGRTFDELVRETLIYYKEDRAEIVDRVTVLMREMRSLDNPPSIQALLIGAIMLMRRSHYPGNEPHAFADYCVLYKMWRNEGLSHEATLAKLYELEKF